MEKKLKRMRNWAIVFTVLFCFAIALTTCFIFEVPWLIKVISEAYNDVTSEVIGDGWIFGAYVSCGAASGIFLILFVTLFSVYGVKKKKAKKCKKKCHCDCKKSKDPIEKSEKESEKLMKKKIAVEETVDEEVAATEETAEVKVSKRKLKKMAKAEEEATETTEETTTTTTEATETAPKTRAGVTKMNMEKFYKNLKK